MMEKQVLEHVVEALIAITCLLDEMRLVEPPIVVEEHFQNLDKHMQAIDSLLHPEDQ
jgi:hypothetical protein